MGLFLARLALLPQGWANNVLIRTDNNYITDVQINAHNTHDEAKVIEGAIIPSMPNLHSHAFQRKLAGRAEYSTSDKDSFWTWRDLMYKLLQKLEADELEEIAVNLYKEILAAGYSHVGEFHYIHHKPDGSAYDDRAELSKTMVRAAKKAGIGITILPVLYAYSNFGEKAPDEGQKRFINNVEQYLEIVNSLHSEYKNDPSVIVGIAFHSLRAVSAKMIEQVIERLKDIDMPIHIHIAEQEKEVTDCIEHYGLRPVEWLLQNTKVNKNWCLVHATHMNEEETVSLAKSGAVVAICPTTEANLGDGLFNLPAYIKNGGSFGIGSDSHVCVDPLEELRWLEYGQRLIRKERSIAKSNKESHVGSFLYKEALKGGAQALGVKTGLIEKGYKADLMILDTGDKNIDQSSLLDSLIFCGNIKKANLH